MAERLGPRLVMQRGSRFKSLAGFDFSSPEFESLTTLVK